MDNKRSELFRRVAGVVFWLLVWQLAAVAINKRIILVSPLTAAKRLGELAFTADFWKTVMNSFCKIALGYLGGMVSGVLFASLSRRYIAAQTIISPFMTAVKSVPVASFVILALFWIKSAWLSVFVAFLIVMPVIYGSTFEGIGSADKKLIEAADIFGFSLYRRVRYLYIPAVMPYLKAACITCAGLAFKSGAAAEVIGQPDFTLGDMLYRSKIYLETADLFAWTAVIIILSKVFEIMVTALLDLFFKGSQRVKGQ